MFINFEMVRYMISITPMRPLEGDLVIQLQEAVVLEKVGDAWSSY
jgi:hypothetical protein